MKSKDFFPLAFHHLLNQSINLAYQSVAFKEFFLLICHFSGQSLASIIARLGSNVKCCTTFLNKEDGTVQIVTSQVIVWNPRYYRLHIPLYCTKLPERAAIRIYRAGLIRTLKPKKASLPPMRKVDKRNVYLFQLSRSWHLRKSFWKMHMLNRYELLICIFR